MKSKPKYLRTVDARFGDYSVIILRIQIQVAVSYSVTFERNPDVHTGILY